MHQSLCFVFIISTAIIPLLHLLLLLVILTVILMFAILHRLLLPLTLLIATTVIVNCIFFAFGGGQKQIPGRSRVANMRRGV